MNVHEFDCSLDIDSRANLARNAIMDYGIYVVGSTVTVIGAGGDYERFELVAVTFQPGQQPVEVAPMLPGCTNGSGNNGTYVP